MRAFLAYAKWRRNLEGDPSDGEWLRSPAAAPIILASSGVESSRSRCARLAWGAVTQLHKVRIFPSQRTDDLSSVA